MLHLLTKQPLDGMPSGLHNSGSRSSAILRPRNASTLYTSQTVRSPWEDTGNSRLIRETEVAQQSRARRKEDFLIAFSPVSARHTEADKRHS